MNENENMFGIVSMICISHVFIVGIVCATYLKVKLGYSKEDPRFNIEEEKNDGS